MKKIFLALVIPVLSCGWPKKCLAQSSPASAPVSIQQVSLQLPLLDQPLDVSNIVNNMHPAYLFDQHHFAGLKGAYLPIVQFHTASGLDLVDLNGGFVWQNVSGIGGPMALVGFRLDNLAARAYLNSWLSKHVSSIKFPSVEAGPWGGYINRLGWLAGGFVSTKL